MNGSDREAVHEAFSVLAHDLRLEIVLALLEEWQAAHTEPRTYTELMSAVGLEDSGKFNYHLEQLRGVYVEQVDGGYVPTASATALFRAVLAHRPTTEHNEGKDGGACDRQVDTDAECPLCGGSIDVRYERQFCTLECSRCGDVVFTYPFPVNGLERRSDQEIIKAVQRRASYEVGLAATGQCFACAGRTSVSLDRSTFDGDADPIAEIRCSCCSAFLVAPVLLPLQFEPQVVSALAELDAVSSPSSLGFEPDVRGQLRATDPVRATLELTTDAGTVTVDIDGTLNVRSIDVE